MSDVLGWLNIAIEWIKSPKHMFIVCLISGFILFAPYHWLDRAGGEPWLSLHLWIFGLLFLFCAASLIAEGLWACGRRYSLWHKFSNLSADELAIFGKYVQSGRTTLPFSAASGAVQHLENEGILYRSSQFGTVNAEWDYTVVPSARKYLRYDRIQKLMLKAARKL